MGLRDPAVHDQPVGRPPSKVVLTYSWPQRVLQTGVAANAAGLYASAHDDRTVRVWDSRQGALVRASIPSHKGWVSAGVSMCTLGATRAGSIPLQGGAGVAGRRKLLAVPPSRSGKHDADNAQG